MAYEYDRYEREEGGSFLMGLLAGTVLGAGLGMLFAPKAGNELRNQLGESAGRLRTSANDAYHQASDKVSQMVDRGRDAYQRSRTGAGEHEGMGSSGMGSSGMGSSGMGNTGSGGMSGGGTSGSGTSGTMGNTGSSYTGAGSTNRG